MAVVVGVTFNEVARSYWFDPGDYELPINIKVVVETSRGIEMGTVRLSAREIAEYDLQAPLKRVLRIADSFDLQQERDNLHKAELALRICGQSIHKLQLPMKLLKADYCFDGSQVTIYFSAEGRVDFRELVKDVAGQLKCKVILHQVGARDQAKVVGGLGPCGKVLCCATFLTNFEAISMKMAKDQSLFLNPVKFSGLCGKLMCCLRFEHDHYVETKKRLPQIGDMVNTPRGVGYVHDVNVIKEEAMIMLNENQVQLSFPANSIQVLEQCACPHECLQRAKLYGDDDEDIKNLIE